MVKKSGRLARSPQLRPQSFSRIEAAASRCSHGQAAIDTNSAEERPGRRRLGYDIIVIGLQQAADIIEKLKCIGAAEDDENDSVSLGNAGNQRPGGIADAKLIAAAAIHAMQTNNNR